MKTSMNKVVSFDIPIISRKEAKEKGFTRYFTGEKCSNGHIDEKLVCNWTCITCKQLKEKEWREKNYEKRITQCRKSGSKWRETHFEVDKLRRKNWKKNNIGYVLFNDAKQRAKIETTLSNEELKRGYEIYEQMHNLNLICQERVFCVDHIIPLSKGGRHHPNNLRITTIKENSSKGNKIRLKDQLLWLENHFGDMQFTKARKEIFKRELTIPIKNV